MGELKSAFEIAMEKTRAMGKASPEELKQQEFVPQGERLAARYLRDEINLTAELAKYDAQSRKYVTIGVLGVLLRNIDLPKNDVARAASKKAMEGLKALKSDKGGVENVYSKLRRLFKHYEQEGEQQKQQAYEAFKADFERRVRQQAQQQGKPLPPNVDLQVELQPQFQEQWRMTLAKFQEQYYRMLEEYKRELEKLS